MGEAPSGTVTLLFTDIEGSTKLLQRAGDAYADLLKQHRRLLRAAFEANGGYEVDAEGDAFFVAFPTAKEAVAAAAEAQRGLAGHPWPAEFEIRVRMGVHTGEPRLIGGRYVGLDVHRAARVMAAGHGGQVVVSHSTWDLLDEAFEFRDLGEHRLKDLSEPQRLYQLQINGLPHQFPALKTLESRQTNLPVQLTPLIGREEELREVTVRLRRDYPRLVTLTGPGGTGKTRLALQLAADVIDDFRDGVFFVSLAPISDPELVVPTIAQALGLREHSGEPLLETLNEYLREKQMLLLLDNFEHVVQAAPSVASLLASAPGLKLLVTSRAPMHISGERTHEVPPLNLPDPSRLPKIAALTQYEAVALFIERAQAAKSGFIVTQDNAPSVVEICVRLDGLPLALELAAARVRSLPLQTLLARFDHRLKLLTGGAQDLDARQRTLQATIEWSYDLLPDQEKELFAALSVFVDGCRLEAAEAVCAREDSGQDVLEGLTSLAEKSLLRQREDRDGEPRYWMLETIREFAYERLRQSAVLEVVRSRHAEYFRHLSGEAAGQFHGEGRSVWFGRLANEQGNLRMALDFWRREPDVQLVVAAAIWPLWWQQGYWRESKRWLDEALAASSDASSRRLKGLEGAYYLAYLQGDLERARTLLDEALTLARRLEDRDGIAYALHGLANVAAGEGDHERWVALDEESLKFSDGSRRALYPLDSLGWIAFAYEDDYAKARSLLEEAVSLGRRFGDDTEVARVSARLATVEAFNGDVDDALTMLQESVELGKKLGANAILANNCLLGFAALRSVQGDAEGAVSLLSASEALTGEMGPGPGGGPVVREIERRIIHAAEQELDADRISSSVEAGRSLSLDEALANALPNQGAPFAPNRSA